MTGRWKSGYPRLYFDPGRIESFRRQLSEHAGLRTEWRKWLDKADQMLDEAFIDEAYALCRNEHDSFGLEAIDTNGAWRGLWLTTSRLCRCHRLGTAGFDPVPDVRNEHHLVAPWRYGRWTGRHMTEQWEINKRISR